MSENLFNPMYVLWTAISALIIIWFWEGWKNWRKVRQALRTFRKSGTTGVNQY